MQGKWLLALGLALILGLGGWALSRLDAWPKKPAPVKETPKAEAPPADFNPNEITLSGRVQPQKVAAVPVPVEGVLENLQVREGEEVSEGQLLARVRNDNLDKENEQQQQEVERLQSKVTGLESSIIAARLEAQRTKAEAELARTTTETARKAFERQMALRKEGATPRLAFEKAEREYKNAEVESSARSSLERQAQDNYDRLVRGLEDARKQLAAQNEEMEGAKSELNAAEIHSPVAGLVVKVNKQNGDAVSAQDKEFMLIGIDLTAMEAVVELAPEEVKRVKPGMPAIITLAENNNEPIPAVLRELDETTAYLDFKSPTPAIVPGLIGQVKILLTAPLEKVAAPMAAPATARPAATSAPASPKK